MTDAGKAVVALLLSARRTRTLGRQRIEAVVEAIEDEARETPSVDLGTRVVVHGITPDNVDEVARALRFEMAGLTR